MVAGELPGLAGEQRPAVGKQDLGLADAAGVEEELASGGMARMVLVAQAQLEVAQGNPCRLAAPAGLDELGLQREQ